MTEQRLNSRAVRRNLEDLRSGLLPPARASLRRRATPRAEHPEELELPGGDLGALLDRYDSAELRALARIDAAIRRLDEGTYGRCASCGGPIPVDRLLARPEASLCDDCKDLELATEVPTLPV